MFPISELLLWAWLGCATPPDSGEPAPGWRDVAAADFFSCGLDGEGRPRCWGTLSWVEPVPELQDQVRIEASGTTVCSLDAEGRATCWGHGAGATFEVEDVTDLSLGACTLFLGGDGDLSCHGGVDPWAEAVAVAAMDRLPDHHHQVLCVLDAHDKLSCFQGSTEVLDLPFFQLAGRKRYQATACVADDCCVLVQGAFECQLSEEGSFRTDLPGPAVRGTWRELSADAGGLCALDAEGRVYCWASERVAVDHLAVTPAAAFVTVDVGMQHACGLDADGAITCWGEDAYGALEVPED